MPAVAYDDYEYDDSCKDDVKNSSQNLTSSSNIYDVYAGGPSNNNNNNNGPLGVENDKLSNNLRFIGRSTKGGNGGGGGSGGHRCPKCGAHVTFQSSSTSTSSSSNKNALQSNCFYCASCSGWFLIQPNLVDGTYRNESSSAHSKYLLSKLGKDGLRKNVRGDEGEEGGSGDNDGILPTTPSKRKIGQKNQFVMRHVSLFVLLFVCGFVLYWCT